MMAGMGIQTRIGPIQQHTKGIIPFTLALLLWDWTVHMSKMKEIADWN